MNQHLSIVDTINRGARRPLTLTCPWCGADPELATRNSGLPPYQKYLVGCSNEDCAVQPQASNASLDEAWTIWNTRHG